MERSTAAGSGGLGADDTTLIAEVEPSSFRAADDRLFVHLSSSKIDISRHLHEVPTLWWECEHSERYTTLQKWKLKNLSSKPGLTSETSGYFTHEFHG